VLRLLARMNWQRDPDSWTVRCRDGRGRRTHLRIRLAPAGITVALPSVGLWVLTPLQAGQLRAAVRDALLVLDRLAGDEHDTVAVPNQRTEPPTPMGDSVPRQRVRLGLPARPSVREIATRVSSTTSDMEVPHDNQHDAPGCIAHRATLAS